jgi:integrase
VSKWEPGAIKNKPGLDRLETRGKVRARYRDSNGKQWSKVFNDPGAIAAAEAWRRERMGEVSTGTHVAASDARVTFGEFAESRIAVWRKHRDTTKAQVDSHMRNHVLPYFEDREVAKISHSDVEAWVAHRSEVLAPATLRVVFAWVRRIFAEAVQKQVIRVSPCDGIELPPVPDTEVEAIPLELVEALADAMPARWRATVLVAAWSGLRQGELLGLRRHRLDLLGQRGGDGKRKPPSIKVVEQLQTLVGGPRLVPPKTAKSKRSVPIPTVLVDALAAHLAAFPADPEGFIFTTNAGAPVSRSRFGEVWRKAVEDAGLPKGTHFHALRHTYATVLIENGESVTAVSKRLGHASPMETLQTYSHLFPDNEEQTVSRLDDAYAALVSRGVSSETG